MNTDYVYFAGNDVATANYGPWIDYEEAEAFIESHNSTIPNPTDHISMFGIAVDLDMSKLVPITEETFE